MNGKCAAATHSRRGQAAAAPAMKAAKEGKREASQSVACCCAATERRAFGVTKAQHGSSISNHVPGWERKAPKKKEGAWWHTN